MKRSILALFSLALIALSGAVNSAPINVTLVKHNQVSTSTVSTLVWKTCDPPVAPATYAAPCINPANAWVVANSILGSNATWTWDPVTQVLSSTGLYWATSHIGSNPSAFSVISDRAENLSIDIPNELTSATKYDCVEGNFLSGVNANGCGSYDLGLNAIDNSSILYNVVSIDTTPNPDPYCVVVTLGGDDVDTGNGRGVRDTFGLTFGCDDTDGAFNLYTVLIDDVLAGGQLQISNGTPISCPPPAATNCAAGANWMTFAAAPTAVDDGPFNADLAGTTPIAVMANDIAYTDNVTVTVTTQPTQGTAVVTGSPGPQAGISIGYTANPAATGTDSFVYTAVDADGITSDTATVNITILQFGANADAATTTRNAPVSINVGANDVGFTNPVTVTITGAPNQGGTATPSAPGTAASQTISYAPAATAPGAATYTETFTYEITDGSVTDSAIVTVTVNNATPVAGDAAVTISTAGVAPGATTTSAFNAGTFAGNNLGNQPSVVSATSGTSGTTSVAGNVVTYTPAANFFAGTDTYTYTITDADTGTPEADTGTVTVTITDVAPALGDGSVTTTSGIAAAPFALAITLGNGSSAQNVRAVTTPAANGTCALSPAGTTVTYTPNAAYSGGDSCTVTITDGDGDTDTGTLSITVNAAGGGGGGGGGPQLPPSSGALDLWSLSLLLVLAGFVWLRRGRRALVPG